MDDLSACRTADLGGHLEKCDACAYEHPVYNSCGSRHCPMCQGKLARRWLKKRMDELLPTPYFHCVFTIPDTFNVLVPCNERVFYGLLFKAAWQSLKYLSKKHLGGEPGVIAVLHTWGQTLWMHPHIHCVVTGGALSADRKRWVSSGSEFLFDVFELSAEFRKRFCRLLRRAKLSFGGAASAYSDPAAFEELVASQEARDWVVYCKKPFAGPETVLEYISRYTHRVAVSNRRLLDVADDGTVTLAYQDYRRTDAEGRPLQTSMELCAEEFIRRFLQHVLPPGFRKIRMYGLVAGSEKHAKLAACRTLLGAEPGTAPDAGQDDSTEGDADHEHLCPRCGKGHMQLSGPLPGAQSAPESRAPPHREVRDAA